MTFRVGMKVARVSGQDFRRDPTLPVPGKGEVFTVSWAAIVKGDEMIDLVELPSPETAKIYRGYMAKHFRPVTSPKAEISFTAGADPDSERHDNRKRVDEPAWGASA